ncbi:3146_t:CDS:2 [Cetraspora pellucida]|uniref:3146_t:CDS:1 n=1 Tax=Cetraspora pellucida TaxID=1433469 RepID=A0ACA9NKW5_9GLOM|nr:3146_t:CDS:2 [Cetraspora pellucida]
MPSSPNAYLEKEFNITISNLDFELYDSYWLKDTSYFRPTWEKIAAEKEAERAKKQAEGELAELAEKNARGRQGKKYFSWPSEIKEEEDFSATSQPAVANPPAPTKKEEDKLTPEEKPAPKKNFPNHRRRISSLDDFISNYLKKEKGENDTQKNHLGYWTEAKEDYGYYTCDHNSVEIKLTEETNGIPKVSKICKDCAIEYTKCDQCHKKCDDITKWDE